MGSFWICVITVFVLHWGQDWRMPRRDDAIFASDRSRRFYFFLLGHRCLIWIKRRNGHVLNWVCHQLLISDGGRYLHVFRVAMTVSTKVYRYTILLTYPYFLFFIQLHFYIQRNSQNLFFSLSSRGHVIVWTGITCARFTNIWAHLRHPKKWGN